MEFTSADIRKALDFVDKQGAKKFHLRPTAPLGLASCLDFEFTVNGKAMAISLAHNGKMTRRIEEEL